MTSTTTDSPRMSRTAAARAVRARLEWERLEPDQERRMGASEGLWLVRHQLNDRIALLRILDALARDPVDALAELQTVEPFASEPAGMVSLSLFAQYLFGAASGGISGHYGLAYFAELRAAAPYVARLH